MRLSIATVALLGLGLLGPACVERCDQAGLAEAAEDLQARTPEARELGFARLRRACPGLPGALDESLVASYADGAADFRATVEARRFEDPDFARLRRQTCRGGSDADAWNRALEATDRDRAVFELCALDRYGLASPSEPFVFADLDAYTLYEWLISNHNDPRTSRELVRGLLAAGADEGTLWDHCVTRGSDCRVALTRRGIELPSSTSESALREGTRLFVSREAVRLGDEKLMELEHARAAPGTFVHHVHGPTRARLEAEAATGRQQAEGDMPLRSARLQIYADRYASFGTVADLIFTGLKAGFTEFELGVARGPHVRTLVVSPSRSWFRPDGDGPCGDAKPLGPTLIVSRDGLVLASIAGKKAFDPAADCWDQPDACYELAPLRNEMIALSASSSTQSVVTLRVVADLPLQTVVSLADLAMGEDCRRSDVRDWDESPGGCRFRRLLLDLEPRLYWNVDRVDTLELGEPVIRRRELFLPGGPDDASLLENFGREKGALRRCLTGSPELMESVGDGSRITLMWGVAPRARGKPTQLRVWAGGPQGPWAPPSVEYCVASALGERVLETDYSTEFVSNLYVEMTIPLSLEEDSKSARTD